MEYTYEDKKAEGYLKRGEAHFQEGRYTPALEELSACLQCAISEQSGWMECKAYNILGDLCLFSGYETAAMENYLNAKKKAKDSHFSQQESYAEMKIGLLYYDMGGQEEALWHFDCAIESARREAKKIDYEALEVAYVHKAYVYYRMGQFADAKGVAAVVDSIRKVHPGNALPLKYKLLQAQLARRSGDKNKLTRCIRDLVQTVMRNGFQMEYCRFYLQVCMFLLECSCKEEMKELMGQLEPMLIRTEFISIAKRFLKLQLLYDKRFSDKHTYRMTCGRYMSQNDSYAGRLLEFRRQNIENLKELQRIRSEQNKYRERSRRDLPTGLLNKVTMEEEIRSYMANRPANSMDALIIFDIDNFKRVNDVHGHLIGDAVISRFSQILKSAYQKKVLLGRFGGDEFVAFIQNITDVEDMERRLEELKDKFGAEKFGKDLELSCTISVGVSYNREVSTSYEALFECADQALYKAKEYGKDKIAFFEIKEGLLKYL